MITNGAADYTEIGVKALSDTELVFELEYASAGFLNSLSSTAAMPCNEEFFTVQREGMVLTISLWLLTVRFL